MALQMNSTYYRAIKAIPYKVVFNRKPRFESLDVANVGAGYVYSLTVAQVQEKSKL